jgi:hypothetical protein
MEVFEQVGSRNFSAVLERNGVVILKEGHSELTRLTLTDALSALAEANDDASILDSTIDGMLRVLIHTYARVR